LMGMNKRQRDYYWPQLVERDGSDSCIRCGELGRIIHHINGDDTDNRLDNLCILCSSCNKLKRLQKKNLPVSTLAYQISASHKKNLLAEPKFRRWLLGMLMSNNGHYPVDFVIKQGAFECDTSTETIRRYLEKLTDHPTSPYILATGQGGMIEVYLREKAPEDLYE